MGTERFKTMMSIKGDDLVAPDILRMRIWGGQYKQSGVVEGSSEMRRPSRACIPGRGKWHLNFSHSIAFSGRACHRSAKAARGEDLQIEHPVSCGYTSTFQVVYTTARHEEVCSSRPSAGQYPSRCSASGDPRRAGSAARGSGSSNGLLERVAREEAHDPPGGNGGRGARFGVAADARPLGAHLPRAEAAQDHGFPLL